MELTNLFTSDELLISIVSYLDRPSISSLASCNKTTESLVNGTEILWAQLWKMRYGDCWDKLDKIRRRRMIGKHLDVELTL